MVARKKAHHTADYALTGHQGRCNNPMNRWHNNSLLRQF